MGKEQSYQNAAKEILRLIGGKENVISAAHCATRLRLVLKNEKLADVDGILNTELVKGQFATGGQFQIIIGSGTVDEVYKYFIQYAELQESSKKEVKQAADQKMNPLQRLVKMLADVFVPIIPALVASSSSCFFTTAAALCDAFWAPDNFWDSPASVRITSRFFSFLRIRLYRCAHTFSR